MADVVEQLKDPTKMSPDAPIRRVPGPGRPDSDAGPTHEGWMDEMKARAAKVRADKKIDYPVADPVADPAGAVPFWKNPKILAGGAAGIGAAGLLAYLLSKNKEEEVA